MNIARQPPLTPAQVARADRVIAALARLWPACFQACQRRRRPLAIGIDQIVLGQMEPAIKSGRISESDIRFALQRNVGAPSYLEICATAGAARIGLDGKPAGTVTETEASSARGRLAARARRANKRSLKEANTGVMAIAT